MVNSHNATHTSTNGPHDMSSPSAPVAGDSLPAFIRRRRGEALAQVLEFPEVWDRRALESLVVCFSFSDLFVWFPSLYTHSLSLHEALNNVTVA